MQHSVGEDFLLSLVHTVEVDGHQEGANLIVGDGPARHPFDEESDFGA